MKAYEFYYADDGTNRVDIEKESLDELKKELINQINIQKGNIDKYDEEYAQQKTDRENQITIINTEEKNKFEKHEKELIAIISDSNEKVKKYEEYHKNQLRFKPSVEYWAKRARDLTRRGRWWMTGLFITSSLLIAGIIIMLYHIPDAFISTNKYETIKASLMLLTAVSIGAYLIRIFSKLTFSSFHLARDSEERGHLTYIYLSLKEEKGMEKGQEDIVMQSIFSRADTGLLGGDHSPTMPLSGIEKLAER
jgi:hypothetical protein